MVGQDQAVPVERLNPLEKAPQGLGIVQVRRRVTESAVHLRQDRSAEPVPARAEVQQQQTGVPGGLELRREGASRVLHRGEGGHHEGNG